MLTQDNQLLRQQMAQQQALEKQQQQIDQKANSLLARCQAGDRGACQAIQGSAWEKVLHGASLTELEANSLKGQMRYAEGGEIDSLMAPEMPMDVVEEDPFMALRDILGDEGMAQVEQAMTEYPAVQVLAEMATYTQDGEVNGMGTGKSDEVPARLSEGEYVLPVEVVEAIGIDKLDSLVEQIKNGQASML